MPRGASYLDLQSMSPHAYNYPYPLFDQSMHKVQLMNLYHVF